jgi:hypothetical protein
MIREFNQGEERIMLEYTIEYVKTSPNAPVTIVFWGLAATLFVSLVAEWISDIWSAINN